MLEGDEMLSVSKINNADARQSLVEVNKLYGDLKNNVSYIIASTDELFIVHKASKEIFTQASSMLKLTEALQDALYQTSQCERPRSLVVLSSSWCICIRVPVLIDK